MFKVEEVAVQEVKKMEDYREEEEEEETLSRFFLVLKSSLLELP